MIGTTLTLNGMMDKDTSQMYIKKGDVLERRNARVSLSAENNAWVNKPLLGTKMLHVVGAVGVNTIVGSTDYLEGNGFIFAVYNSNGNHGLYWFDSSDGELGSISTLLVNPILNFSQTAVVDMRVLGDYLIWTDGINEPRILSIPRALNYSGFGLITGTIYEWTDAASPLGTISVNVAGYSAQPITTGSIGVNVAGYAFTVADQSTITVNVAGYSPDTYTPGAISCNVAGFYEVGNISGLIKEYVN